MLYITITITNPQRRPRRTRSQRVTTATTVTTAMPQTQLNQFRMLQLQVKDQEKEVLSQEVLNQEVLSQEVLSQEATDQEVVLDQEVPSLLVQKNPILEDLDLHPRHQELVERECSREKVVHLHQHLRDLDQLHLNLLPRHLAQDQTNLAQSSQHQNLALSQDLRDLAQASLDPNLDPSPSQDLEKTVHLTQKTLPPPALTQKPLPLLEMMLISMLVQDNHPLPREDTTKPRRSLKHPLDFDSDSLMKTTMSAEPKEELLAIMSDVTITDMAMVTETVKDTGTNISIMDHTRRTVTTAIMETTAITATMATMETTETMETTVETVTTTTAQTLEPVTAPKTGPRSKTKTESVSVKTDPVVKTDLTMPGRRRATKSLRVKIQRPPREATRLPPPQPRDKDVNNSAKLRRNTTTTALVTETVPVDLMDPTQLQSRKTSLQESETNLSYTNTP
jgi:hypothetical protein